MEKEIRNQEIRGRSERSRRGQDLGINLEEMTATESVGYKFILVHKQKYCDSHPICKGNDQFPDQAANVTLGSHG